jgi:hypothetical protein
MTQQIPSPAAAGAPSPRAIAVAIGGAFAVAAALLVTVVLPAEYGVDPLGTGRAMGLTALAGPAASSAVAITAPTGPEGVPTAVGPIAHYHGAYRMDSVDLVIGPYEFVEYKYRLEKGASMLYSWHATAAVVHDMHGEADGATAHEESFDKEARRGADGAFTAPFSGIHGWFWENPGAEPITVTLTSSGFYSAAIEIRSDRTRIPHTPTPVAEVSFSRKNQ